MSVRSRAVLHIVLGLAQLAFAVATVMAWAQVGMTRAVIALAAATAAAVIASLVISRHER